jgi:hypothetical protein
MVVAAGTRTIIWMGSIVKLQASNLLMAVVLTRAIICMGITVKL